MEGLVSFTAVHTDFKQSLKLSDVYIEKERHSQSTPPVVQASAIQAST